MNGTPPAREKSIGVLEQAAIAAGFVLAVCMVILLAGQEFPGTNNFYNSYSVQAQAWLEGRLDIPLGEERTWLELAIRDGRYYVSFPPFPSVVMLPLVLVFGEHTPDTMVALFAAALACWHAIRLCVILLPDRRRTAYWVMFLLLCNGYLFLCVNGWVWYLAQNLCFLFSLAALHHAVRGRGFASLACWAMAVGCRPMAGFCLPFLLVVLLKAVRGEHPDEKPLRLIAKRLWWAAVPLLLGAFYMALNQARFGNPFEFGHNYLPEFNREGPQFALAHIVPNLRQLLSLPFMRDGRLTFSTSNGGTAWLLNPILWVGIAAWASALRTRRGGVTCLWLLPLTLAVYLLVILAHRTLGGWQFGNRYLVDLMPWIFFGILIHQPDDDSLVRVSFPFALLAGVCQIAGTVATYNYWI